MTRAAERPPLTAPADILAEARANCAQRARAREQHELAASFEQGGQDQGWALVHEVRKIEAERGRGK